MTTATIVRGLSFKAYAHSTKDFDINNLQDDDSIFCEVVAKDVEEAIEKFKIAFNGRRPSSVYMTDTPYNVSGKRLTESIVVV
jgi:hypothetical protein